MSENSADSILKWDCLVLTARNAEQCEIFRLQLAPLRLVEREFCRELVVLPDTPDGVRIGSGGATLNAFLHLEQRFGSEFLQHSRVLLLHSGGLSQRIPHVALTGKAFMLMPDGRTLLEHKLRVYRNLLNGLATIYSSIDKNTNAKMPGFVFIASADVLEFFPSDKSFYSNSAIKNSIQSFFASSIQLLLVAHESPLDVATQHGVFYIKEAEGNKQDLVRILQKPSESQLRQIAGAILPNNELVEMALTDSCYLVNQNLVTELLKLRKKFGPIQCELCCYRDFLCPLGSAKDEEKKAHFCMNDRELFKWQQIIWDLMNAKKAGILPLGPESFFHFGTPNELLHHFLQPNSAFRRKFLDENELRNLINSMVENKERISHRSLLEWCNFRGKCRVEDGCILSGLELDGNKIIEGNYCLKEGKGQICIPPGTLACTIPINMDNNEGKKTNVPPKTKRRHRSNSAPSHPSAGSSKRGRQSPNSEADIQKMQRLHSQWQLYMKHIPIDYRMSDRTQHQIVQDLLQFRRPSQLTSAEMHQDMRNLITVGVRPHVLFEHYYIPIDEHRLYRNNVLDRPITPVELNELPEPSSRGVDRGMQISAWKHLRSRYYPDLPSQMTDSSARNQIEIAYVTVIFHREDDLKKTATKQIQAVGKEEYILRWFGHQIAVEYADKTLWECPLFEAKPTANESLFATLRAIKEGPLSSAQHSVMSISEVFKRANVREMLRQRQKLLNNIQKQ